MNKDIKNIRKSIKGISSEVLNGENYSRDDFARSILNYPAMMVPSVQEPIIEKLSRAIDGEVSLLDPFMGASNTLVTGMKYGMNVFGQDINPLSILLSQVKTSFYQIDELIDAEERLIKGINSDKSNAVAVSFINIDKWFTKGIQIELSKIYRAIRKEESLKIRKFFWIVLAETIRLTSNDRTSTFKMHMRPIEEIHQLNGLQLINCSSQLFFDDSISEEYITELLNHFEEYRETAKNINRIINQGSRKFFFTSSEDAHIDLDLTFFKLKVNANDFRNEITPLRHPSLERPSQK